MSIARLYLITHAHTQQDPDTDARVWRLSAAGQQQASLLAAQPWWRTVDRVVLSREAKTRLTVAPALAEYDLPVSIEPRVDELRRGGWVDDYAARVHVALATPDVAAGDWEAAADALVRFRAGVAELVATYPRRTLAVVSHGLVLSLYRAWLLGYDRVRFADWQTLSFAAVAEVDPVGGALVADFRPVGGVMPRA